MASFTRRFTFDPGDDVLLDIESVNILDLEPPSAISGVGTGTVLVVGEFENGPFATQAAVEPSSATDLVNTMGALGYTYGGLVGQNPCARARKSDGALVDEYWNGNAFVQLTGKKFARLLCARVDTSVGAVTFTRQAYVTGGSSFLYNLEPSQILSLDIGAGYVSSTFTATAATVTAVAGTFPTLFTGGETLTIGYDAAPDFVVTFLAADQSNAQVVARINAYAGFTFADLSAGQVRLTGIQRGNGAMVRVVAGSTGVLATLGFTAATTMGTGNVGNIDAVAFTEIKTIVEAAMTAAVLVEQDSQGRLRVSKIYVANTDYIAVGPATTATGLGFTNYDMNSADGVARFRSGGGTYPTLFGGGETLTLGIDSSANFTVTFAAGDQSEAQVIAKINLTAGFTLVSASDATHLLFTAVANGGQFRVIAGTASVLTALGLSAGTTITAGGVVSGTIPAGTVVQNTAATRVFTTMQDVNVTALPITGVTASGVGPYTVKVRHALDDGTGLSATAGSVSKVLYAPDLGSFATVNPQIITAALTETQIDAAYTTAIDTTVSLSSVTKETNLVVSARQSNATRRKLRQNALDASANGMFGRIAIIRTPMNTLKAVAKSNVAEPGVGAYREQRVIYCYPQASTFVPTIAQVGIAGGKGFNATGIVDVGADMVLAAICSQLPPEENPGQDTPFTASTIGIESGANAQNFNIDDYKAFKRAGICAIRVDDGTVIFQSGVTSVDPGVHPGLVNIARRRMADFIQDSLARQLKSYGKKLSTKNRRQAIKLAINTFMNGLLPKDSNAAQRIESFSLTDKANTAVQLGRGMYRLILKVRTLASLDSIVLQTTVGEQVVTIDEVLPQAA